jgi:multiple sugar transport system permease protein
MMSKSKRAAAALAETFSKRVHKKAVRHVAVSFVWKTVHFVVTFGICFIILLPLIQKVCVMFMSQNDIFDVTVAYLPKHFSLKFLTVCWTVMDYPYTILMTFLMSFSIALIQTMSCAFIAYGLARFKFALRGPLFALLIFSMVVPPSVILLPQYFLFQNFNPLGIFSLLTGNPSGLNLLNSWWPFVLTSLTGMGIKNGLYIFLLRQYFRSFPKALEEAAMIDGIGTVRFYFSIAMKLAFSLMATCFILSFVWQWTDIYYTRYYMSQAPILSVKLSSLVSMATPYLQKDLGYGGAKMPTGYENVVSSTGVVLMVVPLILLYLFAQRMLTESIERTGIK